MSAATAPSSDPLAAFIGDLVKCDRPTVQALYKAAYRACRSGSISPRAAMRHIMPGRGSRL